MRYRFISEPLTRRGHDVALLETDSILSASLRFIKLSIGNNKPDALIGVGCGAKVLILFGLCRLRNVPFIIRVGGDSVAVARSTVQSAWSHRKPVAFMRACSNYLSAKALFAKGKYFAAVNPVISKSIKRLSHTIPVIAIVPQYCSVGVARECYRINDPAIVLTVTNLRYKDKADGVIWQARVLIEYVKATRQKVEFRVAGGGLFFSYVQAAIRQEALPQELDIILLGYMNDLDGEYLSADIFIYRSSRDGTPNVLLEAKRLGVPILVNCYEGFFYVVRNGWSALIYQGEVDFAVCFKKLLNCKNLRIKLATNGRLDCGQRFSIEAVGLVIEDLCHCAKSFHSRVG